MKTILVVDDNYVNHQIVSVILANKNYRILSAYNGLEAVQALANNRVDLMLTDINMPYMDGLLLVELMRTGERYRNLPIIVITATPEEHAAQEAAEKGATAFISQPFSSRELLHVVNEYLENKRDQRIRQIYS